jgi:hypothetical protein
MKEAVRIQSITTQCGSFERFLVIARMCLTRPLQSNYSAGKVFYDLSLSPRELVMQHLMICVYEKYLASSICILGTFLCNAFFLLLHIRDR